MMCWVSAGGTTWYALTVEDALRSLRGMKYAWSAQRLEDGMMVLTRDPPWAPSVDTTLWWPIDLLPFKLADHDQGARSGRGPRHGFTEFCPVYNAGELVGALLRSHMELLT